MKLDARRIAAVRLKASARVKLMVARTQGAAFDRAADILIHALESGGKVLFFGNGGSAADCQHLATELVVRFMKDRRALPGIALTTDTSTLTAASNDWGFVRVFARQIEAIGAPGDVVVALSTSGSSPNVLAGIRAARKAGASVIGLTGAKGRMMARLCDACFVVPTTYTPYIQEAHIAIGHILCELIDRHFGAQGT